MSGYVCVRAPRRRLLCAAIAASLFTVSASAELVPDAQRNPAPESVTAARDARLLVLRAGIFDPAATPLRAPDDALLQPRDDRYGIVQFTDNSPGARRALERTGVEMLGYVPNNAYAVRWNGARAAAAALDGVRWHGAYLPAYKLDAALWHATATGSVDLQLLAFPGTDMTQLARALAKRAPGVSQLARTDDDHPPRVRVRVAATGLQAALRALAAEPDVMWIEAWHEPRLHNNDSIGPIQSNTATTPSIWDRGLVGTNQVVAVADSGLDRNHCSFVNLDKGSGATPTFTDADDGDSNPLFAPPNAANLYPDRKIIGYWVQPGSTAYDNNEICTGSIGVPQPTSFHGTHVVGTVLGDHGATATPTQANHQDFDGMAPNAQVLFQDIGNDVSGCLSGIGVLDDMFEQARRGGAHIHSNSWGAASAGAYTGFDLGADLGAYFHEDMLIVFSAGNSGSGANTIGSPGNAKNVLTIGANAHGNNPAIASFSSRGPTDDGRIKPDVTAPGSSIVSASGDATNDGYPAGDAEAQQCASKSLSGTSMSAPTVAGGAALMRQYFTEGWYPTGAKAAADAYVPTGALMKAVLMNGAAAPATLPNNTFGAGRIWLDSNLYFTGDTRELRHFDVPNVAGLATGAQHEYVVDVPPGGDTEELRATLAWYDPPALAGAARTLVNDLDLEVVAPNGSSVYFGNVFATDESKVTGGGDVADTVNNVELFRLKAPTPGTYTVRVKARDVPGSELEGSTRQGYALAVSHATCATAVAAAPASPTATDLGLAGIRLQFGAVANADAYQVYRADGTCATADPTAFRLVGSGSLTSLIDDTVIGGRTYAYRIRGVDGCGEGAASVCVDAPSTAACTLAPSFDTLSVAVVDDPADGVCGTQITWSAATSKCAGGVTYSIHRSTEFDFTPGPTNLIAAGVAGTTFRDTTADPLTTYHYVVRAEDATGFGSGPNNGGNLSLGIRRVHGTATGGFAPGTFADGADSPAFLQPQAPWSFSNNFAQAGTFSWRNAADDATFTLPDQCASLTTPPLVLGPAPVLSYQARYDLEAGYDGVVVEISADGGATWQDLPPAPAYPGSFALTTPTPINACGYPMTQGAFSGTSNSSFLPFSSALLAYAGETVRIRWRFSSDPATEEAGFYLDAVSITDAQAPTMCVATANVPVFGDGFEDP